MRYVCVRCGAVGASSRLELSNHGALSYHCHVCPGKGTMWPEPQAKEFLQLLEQNKALAAKLKEQEESMQLSLSTLQASLEGVCKIIGNSLKEAAN